MDQIKAMYARHSVRHYKDKPLSPKLIKELKAFINKINKENNLHFQLITNEPKAFTDGKASICNFTGCSNYFVLAGKKSRNLKQKVGYYGQMLVLKAQQLGLGTCWAYLTYNDIETAYKLNHGEKKVILIATGYPENIGKQHESKKFIDVVTNRGKLPQWFIYGVKMALLAPTSKNTQGFKFSLIGENQVKIKNRSLCKKIDLGILKYCFEVGASKDNFKWYK